MTYDLTSEQFAVNQAAQWEKIAAPSHCGGAKWIFSDTSSGGRLTCEVARVSGNVDAVRLPKEAYYAIMAIFRDDPQVQILGHWTYPPNTTKPVYVMSNCDEVELRVNGKSIGKGAKSHGYVFTFPSLHFEPGPIEAIGYDDGQPAARQEKKTAGQPRRVKLTAITGPRGWRADGSDVALIDAEVVDDAGNRCPTFQQRIDFTTTGPAIWRGGYNSGKAHSTNNTYLDLECGINRVSLRSTTTAGTIRVEGKVAGLEPSSIELASQPVEIRDGMSPELPAVPAQGTLAQPSPARERRISVGTGEKPQPAGGKLITAFSYSGPSKGCTVQPFTGNEFKAFCDRTTKLRDLPADIPSGEFVQAPCDDKTYSALDLMQFTAGADVDVYIAHDDRVAHPAWLTADFKDTGQKVSIGSAKATLFKRSVPRNAGLTLGGNQGEPVNKSCVMYVVIAVPRAAK
jgi:beta-galactosidase